MEENLLNLSQTISQDEIYNFFGGINLEKIFKREFYPVWAFTNESLEEAGNLTNFRNKEILSILGSADPLIYFLFKGAKLVISCDNRDLSCLLAEFKISALKNLSFQTFREFFLDDKKENSKIYFEKIRENLSAPAKKFFDYLFEGFPRNIFSTLKRSNFFYKESWYFLKKKNWLFYLNQSNSFLSLKKKINNIFILNANLEKTLKILKRKFDLIYTSNIFESRKYCPDPEKTLIQIDLHLKEKGEIFIVHQGRPQKTISLLENLGYNFKIKEPKKRFFEVFLKTYPYYYILAKKNEVGCAELAKAPVLNPAPFTLENY